MSYKNIIFEEKDLIATITFNRPKALNALSQELMGELNDILDSLANNKDVKVLILTGAGEKSFVAGADIAEITKLDVLSSRHFARLGQKIIGKLQKLPIPVICAINGFALGGGCEMALGCDFIYASENAMIGLPEITLGVIPGFGGTQRLSRLIGKNRAKEMVLTGGMITALEAKEIGLVNKVFPLETLMENVMKTAKKIAAKGRVSVRAAKEAINRGTDMDLENGCKLEVDSFAICFASVDSKEGTSAFLEKRKAEFKGKLFNTDIKTKSIL